ncbi:MAG: glycosyltransferase [Bacteroidales bacterium]|nr:glycosyltransferase [Bacteroidales bacterium]
MPAISVIIPVFNAERFLDRCIGSVRDQTFGDWEAVCVDDGSTDRSGVMLDGYAELDPRIRVVHKANEGVSIARNVALEAAGGRFILFLDSDDFLHPQAMEITFSLAERDGSDVVAFTYDHGYRTRTILRHLLHLPESGNVKYKTFRTPETVVTEDIFDWATEYSHPKKKLATKHCQPWRRLYRKDILDGVSFIPGIMYEDFPWWSEVMLRVRKATLTDLPLYFYYPNRGSYIFSSKEAFKIKSLRTAINSASNLYDGVEPSRRARWEKEFLQPFREKLDKKEHRSNSIGRTRLRLLLEGHIFNPLWDGEEKHRQRRCAAFGRILTGFMRKHYLAAADPVPDRPVVPGTDPEKIWSIWLQGEDQAPDIVKSCLASIRAHCSQELVVLDEKSIFERITLPGVIVEKYRAGKIRAAYFADICRVELLHKYGGYWLDATCFVTAPIPEFISNQDFFVFLAGEKVHGNYSYIQNCFIRAQKGAYLLEAWRAMILDYWIHEEKRVDYFQHQVMFRTLVTYNPVAAAKFAGMPQIDQYPTHLYLYEYKDLPYDPELFREVSEEGFFYQKTSYRGLDHVVPGSFADHLVRWYRNRD